MKDLDEMKVKKLIQYVKKQSLTEWEWREFLGLVQKHQLESIGLNENNTRQLKIGLDRDGVENELDRKLTDEEWKDLSGYVKNDWLYQSMREDLYDHVWGWVHLNAYSKGKDSNN